MSVDEMDTSPDSNVATLKADIKKESDVMKVEEQPSTSVKQEIKDHESKMATKCKVDPDKDSLVNGDLTKKIEAGSQEDEPELNGEELRKKKLRMKLKEEEKAEESEDEEPEVTVSIVKCILLQFITYNVIIKCKLQKQRN